MRKKMSKNILEASLEGAEHIVLLGHIHPDGDCIGTTLGLLNYLRENYPQIEAELFLDHPAAKFSYMNDFEKIHTEIVPEKQFDLCITLDASDKERLGAYAVYFDSAAKTLCIDHHRTNTGFAEQKLHHFRTQAPAAKCYTRFLMRQRSAGRRQSVSIPELCMTQVYLSTIQRPGKRWKSRAR